MCGQNWRWVKSITIKIFETSSTLTFFEGLSISLLIAELWRAKRACGAPWVSKSTHPRKFGNHVTVHRPSAPQGNQCSISHFLTSLGAQEDWYCTHIAHQCCDQLTTVSAVSADQYQPNVSRAQVSTHRGLVSFWSYPLTSYQFSNDHRLKFNFFNSYVICCGLYMPHN